MILVPDQVLKPVIETEPGELVTVQLRSHRALGLVLAKEPTQVLIGLLQSGEENLEPAPPFAFNMDIRYGANKDCLSQGRDWVLELVSAQESYPGNKLLWATPGVIYATTDGPIIFFPSLNDHTGYGGYSFDLQAGKLVESRDDGVPYLSWKVWASTEERSRSGASPLLAFTGVPKVR